MKKRKNIILLFIFCLLIPLYLIFFEYNKPIRKYIGNDYVISDELIYDINLFDYNNKMLSVEGWVVFPGDIQDVNKYNKHLWLISLDYKEIYTIDLENTITTDATKFIDDGNNYLRAGFRTSVDLSDLENSHTYYVFICYTYKGMNLISNTNYTIN